MALRFVRSRSASTSIGSSLRAIATKTSRWRSVSWPIDAQGREPLLLLEPLGGSQRHDIGQPLEARLLTAGRLRAPRVAGELARDLEDGELVGPGREPAQAPEPVEPRQDVDQRV